MNLTRVAESYVTHHPSRLSSAALWTLPELFIIQGVSEKSAYVVFHLWSCWKEAHMGACRKMDGRLIRSLLFIKYFERIKTKAHLQMKFSFSKVQQKRRDLARLNLPIFLARFVSYPLIFVTCGGSNAPLLRLACQNLKKEKEKKKWRRRRGSSYYHWSFFFVFFLQFIYQTQIQHLVEVQWTVQ